MELVRPYSLAAALALALALTAPVAPLADQPREIALLVHPSNPVAKLKLYEIERIFSGVRTQWPNGARIQVIDYKPGTPEREAFDGTLFGSTSARNRARRSPMLFVPIEQRSASVVIKLIAVMPNAIGYVWSDLAEDAGLKQVAVIEVEP